MISMTLTERNYPENESIKHHKLPSLENPWTGFAGSHSQQDSLEARALSEGPTQAGRHYPLPI